MTSNIITLKECTFCKRVMPILNNHCADCIINAITNPLTTPTILSPSDIKELTTEAVNILTSPLQHELTAIVAPTWKVLP